MPLTERMNNMMTAFFSILISLLLLIATYISFKSRRALADINNELMSSKQELQSLREKLGHAQEEHEKVREKLYQTMDELTSVEDYYHIRSMLYTAVIDIFSGDASMDAFHEAELDVISGVRTLPGNRFVYMLSARTIPALWALDGMEIKELLQRRINGLLDEFCTDVHGRQVVVEYAFGHDGYFIIVITLKMTDIADNNIWKEIDGIWDSLGLPAQI